MECCFGAKVVFGTYFTFVQTQLLLQHLNSLGVRDGINGSLDQSVDGLPLETHLKKMDELRTLVLKSD